YAAPKLPRLVPVSVVQRRTWTPDDRPWTSDRQHRGGVSAAFRLLIFEWWTRRKSDKLDKLPEYLRDTVDWFMGKGRKAKDKESLCNDDNKLYLEEAVLEKKLPDIDLRILVEMPNGIDFNEWLASHTISIFDNTNLIYGTVSEFCTISGCPDMVGPSYRTYLWFDEKGKKSRVAAPLYIDYVMTFVQKTINDETIFPTKYANEFPVGLEIVVKKILRLLFHVIAHLYHSHFRELVLLNLHTHLNCVFAHLSVFNHRYQLIELRETEILQDLVVALKILGDDEEVATEVNESIDEYKDVINKEPTMSFADQPINMFPNPSPINTQTLATQIDNF
ncbi:MOB kinase activator-like 2, partial [Myzus persicae]|uniref:MOB kinase activator-like 2 n=1 Tax=Myzus persicae TaxID=13164 RepID=UPI000B9367CA